MFNNITSPINFHRWGKYGSTYLSRQKKGIPPPNWRSTQLSEVYSSQSIEPLLRESIQKVATVLLNLRENKNLNVVVSKDPVIFKVSGQISALNLEYEIDAYGNNEEMFKALTINSYGYNKWIPEVVPTPEGLLIRFVSYEAYRNEYMLSSDFSLSLFESLKSRAEALLNTPDIDERTQNELIDLITAIETKTPEITPKYKTLDEDSEYRRYLQGGIDAIKTQLDSIESTLHPFYKGL